MMTIKRLNAFVALVALGLAAACSTGNQSVVPGASGIQPDETQASTASSLARLQHSIIEQTKPSPIKITPSTLDFSAVGTAAEKHATIVETGYKGEFTFKEIDGCGKQIELSEKTAKGPRTKLDVTPKGDVSCAVLVSDAHKHTNTLFVEVTLPTPQPSPTASPSAGPSSSPSASPSAHPSSSPSASPSASPSTAPSSPGTSPSPSSSPTIANGNFATGTLAPWTPCSFARSGYSAPINPSPEPTSTAAQAAGPYAAIPTATLAPLVTIATPPPNLNPNVTATLPPLGSYVAFTGDQNGEFVGTQGICQSFTVNAAQPYLSFWAYEAGSEYKFAYADQEADILDSTGTTLQQTLFAELSCFDDPTTLGTTAYTASGCEPSSAATPPVSGFGGTSTFTDWQGGYWVPRGPYNLSSYAGQTITLFIGVFLESNSAPPSHFWNGMWIGNVQMSATTTFPTSFPGVRHRAALKKTTHPIVRSI